MTAGLMQAQSVRIKDISYFRGAYSEQLIGYGLVTGLAGTGDSHRSAFTMQSAISMLKRFGITVPEVNLRTRNIAAVTVTARITNQLKQGAVFDVTVSSMGDATSLLGGTLLYTPLLLGRDGDLYAYAQGPVSLGGGYDISTRTGGRIVKNHALTGRIPNGGIMEGDIPTNFVTQNTISIILEEPDFTTANNVANTINQQFPDAADPIDASEIVVTIPPDQQANLTGFLATLEALQVTMDGMARVVLNERTGTIVAGANVFILPCTISHGNLKIIIRSFPIVSQPGPFSGGETVYDYHLVPIVKETETNGPTESITTQAPSSTVQEVIEQLKTLKVTPRDIIAIFQAIKEAGSLPAELVVI